MSRYITVGLLGYLVGMKQKDLQKMVGWARMKKKLMRMMRLG